MSGHTYHSIDTGGIRIIYYAAPKTLVKSASKCKVQMISSCVSTQRPHRLQSTHVSQMVYIPPNLIRNNGIILPLNDYKSEHHEGLDKH